MSERRAHAIIDLSALQRNFLRTRELSGRRDVIAVVKADAYGHGAISVARSLEAAGCRRFGVVTPEEGCELRESGIVGDILVMGGMTTGRDAQLSADCKLCPVIHSEEDLDLAREAGEIASRPMGVEIEVDTGMQRMGVAHQEATSMVRAVSEDPRLSLDGVYTHFAHADAEEQTASLSQINAFRSLIEEWQELGIRPASIHASNSSALHAGHILLNALPEATAIRPGLMLYGATSVDREDPDRAFQPVMSVRTRVAAVRNLLRGDGVGYGSTWRAESSTRVATLSLGYADGVPRVLSNRGQVWLAGAPRPIVGRVSMDYLAVELGDASVHVGDLATYFGPSAGGGPGIRVEKQAEWAGTIAYELLTGVGNRVYREPVGGT